MNLRRLMQNTHVKLWSEFAALALIILLPLLGAGYILTLDLVFTPHYPWPNAVSNSYPLDILLWALTHILPGDLVEKLILFTILLFSGVGMFKLAGELPHPVRLKAGWPIACYSAGLLYMINPFIYARFMAGQWKVLLGYALLPFFLRALFQFLESPHRKQTLLLCGWFVAICIASLHHIGMMMLFIMVFGAGYLLRYRHSAPRLRQYGKWGGIGGLLILIANLYWLVPIIMQKSTILQATIGMANHFEAFAASGGALGTMGDVVRMQGFWAEERGLFLLPQSVTPAWGLVVVLLWGLLLHGAIKAWRSSRLLVCGLVACTFVAVTIASTPLLEWTARSLPLLSGYREPQKFVNVLVLAYAVLFAYGVGHLLYSVKSKGMIVHYVVIGSMLLLPIVITPTMLGGFAGQLTPRAYPAQWYAMNARLKQDKRVSRVLFLPWHQYASFSFSQRIIATPAEKFFDVPVLASDNPEYKNISATVPNREKQVLANALEHPDDLQTALKTTKISHILLAKEQDWQRYGFVKAGARLIYEDTKLQLYEVKY